MPVKDKKVEVINVNSNLRLAKPKTSLFVILARDARVAVILRRGPSKQVQLIKWNLVNDHFEEGQWFKGRIYERRCDLSQDGEKLIYFAAKYNKPIYSWTAVSKPPYLTALLLWPKSDVWAGGGFFETPLTIALNHKETEMDLAEGFHLEKNVKVKSIGKHAGYGEDNPIYHTRLLRDGWKCTQEGVQHENGSDADMWIVYEPAIEYRKDVLIKTKKEIKKFELAMQIKGLSQKNDSWYIIEYQIYDENNKNLMNLEKLDWADWDKNADLLFSKEGKLFRLKPNFQTANSYDLSQTKLLADFSQSKFKEKVASKKDLLW